MVLCAEVFPDAKILHALSTKLGRVEYGKELLSTVAKELVAEFGHGYFWPNLSRIMALAEAFPEQQILATLSRELHSFPPSSVGMPSCLLQRAVQWDSRAAGAANITLPRWSVGARGRRS